MPDKCVEDVLNVAFDKDMEFQLSPTVLAEIGFDDYSLIQFGLGSPSTWGNELWSAMQEYACSRGIVLFNYN